ncbi:hypothetical protein G6F56_005285 [Rhizopus delemar]|nr:hypothetical protein G6F56_005285 [Rhizopus delemar]
MDRYRNQTSDWKRQSDDLANKAKRIRTRIQELTNEPSSSLSTATDTETSTALSSDKKARDPLVEKSKSVAVKGSPAGLQSRFVSHPKLLLNCPQERGDRVEGKTASTIAACKAQLKNSFEQTHAEMKTLFTQQLTANLGTQQELLGNARVEASVEQANEL